MRAKLKIPPLMVALLVTLLTIILPHSSYAQTDACATTDPTSGMQMNGTDAGSNPIVIGDPPGVVNSGLGGWGGPYQFGTANNVYQNNLQHVVTNRANAKHQMIQNSLSISASLHYCFNEIEGIYDAISSSSLNLMTVAIGLIITRAITGLIAALCQMVLTTINTAIQQVLGMINNLLCVPMPRLQIQGLRLGLPTTVCRGTSLAKLGLVPQGTTNNIPPNQLIWTLWKGKTNPPIGAQQ